MSDPLIERITQILNNGWLRRIQFFYRTKFFGGLMFPDLVPKLETDLVPPASPRVPAPGKFAVIINDRNPTMMDNNADAYYSADERMMVIQNRNPATPILVHECFHAARHLDGSVEPGGQAYLEEEVAAFIWQGIAEVIWSGICRPLPPRVVPLPTSSAGIPVTGILGAPIVVSNSVTSRYRVPQGSADAVGPIAQFLFDSQIMRNDYTQDNITNFPLTRALEGSVGISYRRLIAAQEAAWRRASTALPEP
jgi:hypothetical protein